MGNYLKTQLVSTGRVSRLTGAVGHDYGTFGMLLSFLVLLTSNYHFYLDFLLCLKKGVGGRKPGWVWVMGLRSSTF